MIKNTSLRLGNWVSYAMINDPYQIESLNKEQKTVICNPIPLTVEILLQCGFKKEIRGKKEDFDGEETVYFKNGIDIYSPGEDGSGEGFSYATYTRYPGRGFKAGINVATLHHLQNLYHALTNEELEWKMGLPVMFSLNPYLNKNK